MLNRRGDKFTFDFSDLSFDDFIRDRIFNKYRFAPVIADSLAINAESLNGDDDLISGSQLIGKCFVCDTLRRRICCSGMLRFSFVSPARTIRPLLFIGISRL
ncbi:hypothetical protein D3C76_1500940 [compost metagenome]